MTYTPELHNKLRETNRGCRCAWKDETDDLLDEIERLQEVERKAIEQSQDVQMNWLSPIETMASRKKEFKALGTAVKAIYFSDSSDYVAFLWEIVEILGGEEAYNLLENDEAKAVKKYCPELGD